MSEFNLSDKLRYGELNSYAIPKDWIQMKDVREFIRRLKDDIVENDIYTADEIFRIINERAGERLR